MARQSEIKYHIIISIGTANKHETIKRKIGINNHSEIIIILFFILTFSELSPMDRKLPEKKKNNKRFYVIFYSALLHIALCRLHFISNGFLMNQWFRYDLILLIQRDSTSVQKSVSKKKILLNFDIGHT
jgi:hypothetical protein